MIENVAQVSSPDPTTANGPAASPQTADAKPGGLQGGDAKSAANAAPTASPSSAQAATQLFVQQDGKGVFVYRLVDTATGRVLAEVPREQVEQLRNSPDYTAGAFVSTSA